jgi:hypothetical protein
MAHPVDAGPDLADTGPSTTLTMQSFTVPPGAELYKCQDFANPYGGADVQVKAFDSHMSVGSHHLFVFFKQNATDGALTDCSGLEFAPFPYGTQRPDDTVVYPDQVGELIPGYAGLRLQVHYINTTQAPIDVSVHVNIHLAKPGTVTIQAAPFFFNNTKLSIPSTGEPVTATKTCKIPVDMNVFQASSHMHLHGINFAATSSMGMTLYTNQDWNEPKPAGFDPPMLLPAGSTVTFTCAYVNNSGQTLTFGEHALTNEMCIFFGQYYPAPTLLTCF